MASTIRVLHCIHSLSGGGAEKQLRILSEESGKQAMVAGIFCVNDKGNDIHDTQVRIYRSGKANKYNLNIFRSLDAAIEDFRPDLLHAWLPASVTIPAMILALKNRLPCLFSYRVAMSFNRPIALPEYFLALFAASRIVTNNVVDHSQAAYRFLYRCKRGVQIKNAVRLLDEYQKGPVHNVTDGPYKVLFVGRITKQKNWPCVLRALLHLGPDCRIQVIICGDGEEKAELFAMADELALTDKLQYLGYQQDIYRIMQSCDMLVLPSWFEGMPNVLLEALQIGLPCIVSDIPAHRDIIGGRDCALLFDPSDPKELAAGIRLLCDNHTIAQELADKGRAVAANYLPERMAREYYELYANILGHQTGKLRSRARHPQLPEGL